jgi:hypothetical protein
MGWRAMPSRPMRRNSDARTGREAGDPAPVVEVLKSLDATSVSAVSGPNPVLAQAMRTILAVPERVFWSGLNEIVSANGSPSARELATEEVLDDGRDLISGGLKGEVSRVLQAHLRLRIVAFEGLGAGSEEERIVLAPYTGGRSLRARYPPV